MAKTTKSKPKTKAADLDDEPIADEEETDAAEPDADAEDSVDEPAEPSKPKAKVSMTTLAFIILNWIVVPAFIYLAYADHMVRTRAAYESLLNYVAEWGLPLESEDEFPSASNVARANMRLSPEQLSKAFADRKTGKRVPAKEEFVPVEEPVTLRLRPSDIKDYPDFLKNVFGKDGGEPVATLDAEIRRLAKVLPGDIEKAAKDVRETFKGEDEKRDAARKILLPIAFTVWQVKKLDQKIAAAKGPELDTLVEEAVQRRIYYDILAPVNVFRPDSLNKFNDTKGDPKNVSFFVEKIADVKDDGTNIYDLKAVKEALEKRLAATIAERYDGDLHIGDAYAKATTSPDAMKRDSIEKRQKIAFVLFTVGQVKVPGLDKKQEKKLYPKGIERAQIVSGVREFTGASIFYVRSLRVLEERIEEAVIADRQSDNVAIKDKPGESMRIVGGQIDRIENEIDRLIRIVAYIDTAQKRLDDIKGQRDHFKKIHAQRLNQYEVALEKLLTARTNTEKYVKDLQELQTQLHTALVELSDAAERNYALHDRIVEIETAYKAKADAANKKGGKKRP